MPWGIESDDQNCENYSLEGRIIQALEITRQSKDTQTNATAISRTLKERLASWLRKSGLEELKQQLAAHGSSHPSVTPVLGDCDLWAPSA